MSKVALITGCTGQDGSYLAEFLLDKGYEVHGIIRRVSVDTTERIDHIRDRIHLHYGDLTDYGSLVSLMQLVKPDEVYNLAAQSDVGVSFKIPLATGDITGMGVARILDSIRTTKPDTKFYQASSSELFGKSEKCPQNESTPFYPRSPYGVAKLYGYWLTRNYRESYNMFACNGILFNHESPRRGDNFVTKKIVKHLVEVWKRKRQFLELGNLEAKRDWGFAGDYVEGMWLMLQQDKPDDYVLATNETHTVREFVEETAKCIGMNLSWQKYPDPLQEIGYVDQKVVVKINPDYYRPAEVDILLGDYSKAKRVLGWSPKTTFKDLVRKMVEAELNE